jgi:hypothetical protein
VRIALWSFLGLLGWGLGWVLLIRQFSGASWQADWLEHYQRALFFHRQLPDGQLINGGWPIPARPPMMNVLVAHVVGYFPIPLKFAVGQVVALFLNMLVFFPCCLLLRHCGRFRAATIVLLAVVLALNPLFVQNAAYPWTKSLASFFILLAVALYVRFRGTHDRCRLMAAAACMAAAILVHYCAVPYAMFLGGHYLVFAWPHRRRKIRELAWLTLLVGAMLGSWFGWILLRYGWRESICATSTVSDSMKYSLADNCGKVVRNIWYTVVPHPLRMAGGQDVMRMAEIPLAESAFWRDYLFLLYQTNLLWAMGMAGMAGLAVLLYQRRSARLLAGAWHPGGAAWFWAAFVVAMIVVGVAVHGEPERFGVAHITLQPLILLGVTWVVANIRSAPYPARVVFVVAAMMDVALGIVLHQWLQTKDMVFRVIPGVGMELDVASAPQHGMIAFRNAWFKASFHLRFMGDLAAPGRHLVMVLLLLAMVGMLALLCRLLLASGHGGGPSLASRPGDCGA